MHRIPFRPRAVVAALTVAAALTGLAEALLSPLQDGTETDNLHTIAAHQHAFVVSVLIGTVSTLLSLPAFAGLAGLAWVAGARARVRVLAVVTGALTVTAMACFTAVRMVQAVELQAVRDGLPTAQAGHLVDGATGNPVGALLTGLFLAGYLGVVLLAVTLWRSRVAPWPAALLLLLFPVADLVVPGHLGSVVAQVVLAAGLCWTALRLVRPATVDVRESVPVPAIA